MFRAVEINTLPLTGRKVNILDTIRVNYKDVCNYSLGYIRENGAYSFPNLQSKVYRHLKNESGLHSNVVIEGIKSAYSLRKKIKDSDRRTDDSRSQGVAEEIGPGALSVELDKLLASSNEST